MRDTPEAVPNIDFVLRKPSEKSSEIARKLNDTSMRDTPGAHPDAVVVPVDLLSFIFS